MDRLISVVVPIYKVEKYLDRCVESLLNQTYTNLQIILVDDGSPDNCGNICDAYANRDARIDVIHKVNGGLSDARNAGIKIAQGELISFVDSDDYVAINYIEELYKIMTTTDADLAVVGVEIVNEESTYSIDKAEGSVTTITGEEAIELALKTSFRQSAWGKLYKTRIFEEIEFPKGLLYEDLAVVYNILYASKKVAISDAKLYKYEIRPGSIMQESFNIAQYNSLVVTDRAMDFVKLQYPKYEKLADGRRVYSYFTVLHKMLNSPNSDRYKVEIQELKNRINTYSHGLILDKNIKPSLKMRLLSYRISDKLYLKIEDMIYRKIEGNYAK